MESYQNRETWQVTKPIVRGRGGLVCSQHYLASEAGARILRAGGNAVDAAVTAGLALGVVEPWMSGIGGGGFMQFRAAGSGSVTGIDFAMVAPAGLDPDDYPLAGGRNEADRFNWPGVFDDRHTTGPYSIAVPGHVAGLERALAEFGTLEWQQVIEPALELVRFGLPLDWFATQKIATSARDLARHPSSRRIYLPEGLPPVSGIDGVVRGLPWRELGGTYERLAEAGPGDFYRGTIAGMLAADASEVGSSLVRSDLDAYEAAVFESRAVDYHGARVWTPVGQNAGPSLAEALVALEGAVAPRAGGDPGPADFEIYTRVLLEVYEERLARMGIGAGSGNTSHLSVVDQQGNLVSWTQTVMSAFGSKVVFPSTGVTMNNGIMWFDPVPGRANSIRPGVRPLSNMCPTIVERADGYRFAIGACGGRKIFPALMQIISFLVDFEMPLDNALRQPRIDVSGTDEVSVDRRLSAEVLGCLERKYRCTVAVNGVYPNRYALPNVVAECPGGGFEGGAFIMSPTAAVVAV